MTAYILQFRATSRALLRSAADTPLPAVSPARLDLKRVWRRPTGHSASVIFFPESEAQKLTLGPRLPHQRHPMTADEAFAGILLAIVFIGAIAYLIARFV